MKRVYRSIAVASLVTLLAIMGATAKPTSSEHAAWLGVYTQSVDDNLADGFKLPVKSGAIINRVVEDSPADQAGFMSSDIVVSINGSEVKTADDLTSQIRDHKSGDEIAVKVLRDGKEREIKVTLGERNSAASEDNDWSFNVPKARTFQFYNDEYSDSYIGVELTSLSDQLKEYFGVTGERGVLVSTVEEDTPADKAGLKAGDIIVKVDSDDVSSASDVRDAISDNNAGDKVSLTIVRDRKEMTLPVEVAERESHGSRKSVNRAYVIPDVGKVPQVPRMKGLWFGTQDKDQAVEDLRDDIKALKDQIADLKKQMEDMRQSRK
jgi:S1-C subfamily serine protease